MHLNGLTCLLIACKVISLILAKYDELDDNIPRVKDFLKMTKSQFDYD